MSEIPKAPVLVTNMRFAHKATPRVGDKFRVKADHVMKNGVKLPEHAVYQVIRVGDGTFDIKLAGFASTGSALGRRKRLMKI